MRLLKIEIPAQYVEINIDEFYGEDYVWEDDNDMFDDLYDGVIHELISQPDYTWEIVNAKD